MVLAGDYTGLDIIMLLADLDFKLFVLQNVLRLSETQKNMGNFKNQHYAGQQASRNSSFTHYHCIDRAIEEKSIPAIIFVSI